MDDASLIAACRLDRTGLGEQRDRYRSLGAQAEEIVRERGSLTIRFGPGLDEALLRETIAIEEDCCSFFRFEFSAAERRLQIGVATAEQDAALDALAVALGTHDAPASRRVA